jgi:hypothetical protein
MTGELVEEEREVLQLHRHRPAADPAVGGRRVRKTDEPFTGLRFEELNVRRERLLSRGSLGNDHLVQ